MAISKTEINEWYVTFGPDAKSCPGNSDHNERQATIAVNPIHQGVKRLNEWSNRPRAIFIAGCHHTRTRRKRQSSQNEQQGIRGTKEQRAGYFLGNDFPASRTVATDLQNQLEIVDEVTTTLLRPKEGSQKETCNLERLMHSLKLLKAVSRPEFKLRKAIICHSISRG